jgi:superfamily I DNA/RNA helicase
VRTFHAAAWRLVGRPNAERLGRFAEASILGHSDSVRLARQAIAELAGEPGGRRFRGLEPREADGRIAYAKAHLWTPADLEHEGPLGAALAAVWRRYARLARAASAFDFEDMLAAACHLLRATSGSGAAFDAGSSSSCSTSTRTRARRSGGSSS